MLIFLGVNVADVFFGACKILFLWLYIDWFHQTELYVLTIYGYEFGDFEINNFRSMIMICDRIWSKQNHLLTGWWQLKDFFIFTTLGKMNPFWRAYFSTGLVQPPTSCWLLPIWTCFSLTFSSLWSWVILGPGLSPRAVSRASGLLWTLGTEGAFWGTDPIQYDFELVFGKSHKIHIVSKVRCACCFPPIFFNASNGSAGLVFQFQRCVTIRKLAIEPKRMPLLSWNLGSWNCNQRCQI